MESKQKKADTKWYPPNKKRAPIKRPNRFDLSNQLKSFCTPANNPYVCIIS